VQSELHIKTHAIPDWSEIGKIREHVALALSELRESIRDAAVMVVSELVENAIKYGESVPGAPGIEVSVVREHTCVSITVVSGTRDDEAARRLRGYTEALAASRDKLELYMARMQSLADSPEPHSRLGLYRIGVEGAFDLRCSHENGVLRITATRSLEP
jgi:anti-sigma regulatory factor (Ser/Thr protein kinase)